MPQNTPNTTFGQNPYSTKKLMNITTATVVKAGAGVLYGIQIIVAGAAGTVNDLATTAGAAAANQMAVTPATIGAAGVPAAGIPYTTGLMVAPGAGQTVVVVYT